MNSPLYKTVDAQRTEKRRGGMAILLTSMIIMLVSMLALSAIRHSEQESTSSARTRNTVRTMYTADAGIQLALSRLAQSPPDLTAFNVMLDGGANLQSRTRTQSLPQDLDQTGLGTPAEGYTLNQGAGVSFVNRLYLVNVTALYGTSTCRNRSAARSNGA